MPPQSHSHLLLLLLQRHTSISLLASASGPHAAVTSRVTRVAATALPSKSSNAPANTSTLAAPFPANLTGNHTSPPDTDTSPRDTSISSSPRRIRTTVSPANRTAVSKRSRIVTDSPAGIRDGSTDTNCGETPSG